MLVVSLVERKRNLRPQILGEQHGLVVVERTGIVTLAAGNQVLALIIVVVVIQDDIHSVGNRPVNDFFYALHPCAVNRVIGIDNVIYPAARNADCLESCGGNCVNHFFCRLGLTPAFFGFQARLSVCVQRVSQIPTAFHIFYQINRGNLCIERN